MKEIVDKVKITAVRSLTRQVLAALENAALQIEAQAMRFTKASLPPIREESQALAERFMTNLNAYFDGLTSLQVKETSKETDYDGLSLVDHDYLEAMIAMEGMVKNNRETERPQHNYFLTRLREMFPNFKVDESNNPLDPEQIGDCFNESIRPMGLKAHYLLTIYREFNKEVFNNLEDILHEANGVLIECGVLPNLDLKARQREEAKKRSEETAAYLEEEEAAKEAAEEAELAAHREKQKQRIEAAKARKEGKAPPAKPAKPAESPKPSPQTEAQAPGPSTSELFTMMQTLVQGLAANTAGAANLPVAGVQVSAPVDTSSLSPDQLAAQQQALQAQQEQLVGILNAIQGKLNTEQQQGLLPVNPEQGNQHITESINETLQASSASGELDSVSAGSADVMNLVTLIYEAIWKDETLPTALKELIGRTQISIMKVALTDDSFFNDQNHPGRVLLNEYARAGISWTDMEAVEEDPFYLKVEEQVEQILDQAKLDNDFLQQLITELRAFKVKYGQADEGLEKKLRETQDLSNKLGDVREYVRQKVKERILKGELDPSIRQMLDSYIHEFLVKLVLREGPEGSSWKPVLSTIDVLLWTVQAEKQPGDRERFDRINPRLLENLQKFLGIGGASKTKINRMMRQLKQVQEFTFHQAEAKYAGLTAVDGGKAPEPRRREAATLPRDDPYMMQVEKLPVGTWLEFQGVSGRPVRAMLSAKIDSIDKLFFSNNQGKKVLELSRTRLAQELKLGSVKVVTAGRGAVVDRAMESVISNLQGSASDSGSAAQA